MAMPCGGANSMQRKVKAALSLFLLIVGLWAAGPALATDRGRTPIDGVWTFKRADPPGAGASDYDDADWPRVTLPHSFNGSDGDDGGRSEEHTSEIQSLMRIP